MVAMCARLAGPATGYRHTLGMNDDQLLDFDPNSLGRIAITPADLLARFGDAYREHLALARFLDGYCERRDAILTSPLNDEYTDSMVVAALCSLARHLRRGDLLPGGALYDDDEPPDGDVVRVA
jgi:hypothetical protein